MDGMTIAPLWPRLRRGVFRHVTAAAPIHLSRTIDVARILLIVGIVFLHYGMYPNFRANPFGGMSVDEHEVATFVNSFLLFFFFATVPLLSVISGWLFFSFLDEPETRAAPALGKRIRARCLSLYLPLVIWNAIFIGMLLVLRAFVPDHPVFAALNIDFDTATVWQYFNAVFAVDHYPVAFQFWFVRDLFVTVLLSPLILWLIRHAPRIGAAVLLAAWLLNYDFEIFFRPDVAFFFFLGGLIRAKRFEVRLSGRAVVALLAAYLALVTLRALAPFVFEESTPLLSAFTRAMRLVGVLACWGLFLRIAQSRFGSLFARLGPFAFFLYAAHFPLMAEVKRLLWELLPEVNDFWMVVHYLSSVSFTILLCLGGGFLLARFLPGAFALLNGGRPPVQRSHDASRSPVIAGQRGM